MRALKQLALALGFSVALGVSAHAESVGQVEFARGVGFVQSPGQKARTLGEGVPLQAGDTMRTLGGATAIVKLQDGTRMTLRPNTELKLDEYRFQSGGSDNSMVMSLLRGGLRAITGLINKSSPNAARIRTTTATVGIRGTDFDARICAKDCEEESGKIKQPARTSPVQASAKLVSIKGIARVLDEAGNSRTLQQGGAVYPGETVETAGGAVAVLAFRDESRATLGGGTTMRVDKFEFRQEAPESGQFLVALLKGSMRALTGLIGKAQPGNVKYRTPTATVGVRGTGLDLDCSGTAGCSFFTWLGSIEVTPDGQTAAQVLASGQGLFVGRDGIRPLTDSPIPNLDRPDGVPVDFDSLFGNGPDGGDQEGLYVFVRDGHIEVVAFGETLQLGRGETGYVGDGGNVYRLPLLPLFIDYDTEPMPDSDNPGLVTTLNDLGLGTLQCQ